MIKLSYIRKLTNGKYRVFSEKGKNMGTFDSLKAAKKRLQQIEFFKHKKGSLSFLIKEAKIYDITFTYSGIIRFLRQEKPEMLLKFMQLFKEAFDNFADQEDDLDKIEKTCLLECIQKIDLNE